MASMDDLHSSDKGSTPFVVTSYFFFTCIHNAHTQRALMINSIDNRLCTHDVRRPHGQRKATCVAREHCHVLYQHRLFFQRSGNPVTHVPSHVVANVNRKPVRVPPPAALSDIGLAACPALNRR